MCLWFPWVETQGYQDTISTRLNISNILNVWNITHNNLWRTTYIYETFFTDVQYLPVYPNNINQRDNEDNCYKDEITVDIEL